MRKSVGVIVCVQGASRFFYSVCVRVILCAVWVAVLGLPVSAVQLPNSTPIQDPQASEGQQQATSATDQVSTSTPAQPDEAAPPKAESTKAESATDAASQMPTAGRIEAADALGDHDAPAASVASPPAVPNTQPSAVPHQGGPASAKYDVSQIGHRSVGSGLDFYSLDREIALGRQLSSEVEQSARLLTDPRPHSDRSPAKHARHRQNWFRA